MFKPIVFATACFVATSSLTGVVKADTSSQYDDYVSISAGLMAVQAAASKQSIESYVESHKKLLSAASATKESMDSTVVPQPPVPSPSSSPAATDVESMETPGTAVGTMESNPSIFGDFEPMNVSSMDDLKAQLAASGTGFTKEDYSSLSALTASLKAKAGTADAAVVTSTSRWFSKLSKVDAPKLKSPKGLNMPSSPGIPEEALPYGLFASKAWGDFMQNSPDLISQVSKTGVGTSQLKKQWANTLADSWNKVGSSLEGAMPSKCATAMMGTMASGKISSQGADCPPSCTVGGMYLHSQVMNMAVTKGGNVPGGGVIPYNFTEKLPPQVNHDLLSGNVSLSNESLNETLNGEAAKVPCLSASNSAKTAAKSSLPGVFSKLSK